MKVLMVLTSHDQLGNTGLPAGVLTWRRTPGAWHQPAS